MSHLVEARTPVHHEFIPTPTDKSASDICYILKLMWIKMKTGERANGLPVKKV